MTNPRTPGHREQILHRIMSVNLNSIASAMTKYTLSTVYGRGQFTSDIYIVA